MYALGVRCVPPPPPNTGMHRTKNQNTLNYMHPNGEPKSQVTGSYLPQGIPGFQVRGVNRAPKIWGGGWEGSIDGQLWRRRRRKISPNNQQMMTFLSPLDALIPKIAFSFLARGQSL